MQDVSQSRDQKNPILAIFTWAAADLVVLGTARLAKADLSAPQTPEPSPGDTSLPAAAPAESRLSTEIWDARPVRT